MTQLIKILTILFFSVAFFVIEFLIFNVVGRWFVPNLLLLTIVFFNFYLGIRYGILTAAICGILKDSFNVDIFGGYFLSFILCAYLATVLRRYVYHGGVLVARYAIIFSLVIINFFVLYFLQIFKGSANFLEAVRFILIPELIITLLLTNFIFNFLKKCASKLFA